MIVTISGDDGENSGTRTVADLPAVTGRTYRAVELEPGYDQTGAVLEDYIRDGDDDTYNTNYEVEYDHRWRYNEWFYLRCYQYLGNHFRKCGRNSGWPALLTMAKHPFR